MSQRRNIFQLVKYLDSHPNQPVKVIAEGVGCDKHQIQKWLPLLEVNEELGRDPVNGRKNVKLYSIKLPREKAAALAHKG